MHELGSIDVMRLDQTLGQSRHDVSHGPSVLLFPAPLSERSKIVAMMVSHFALNQLAPIGLCSAASRMMLPAGNASAIFGITNTAPTSRVPLSSSTSCSMMAATD
jgi:hypothetical protein